MPLKTAVTRAARAMREDLRLHFVAISSLTVAFLCLATVIFGMTNLGSVAETILSSRCSFVLGDSYGSETEPNEQGQ